MYRHSFSVALSAFTLLISLFLVPSAAWADRPQCMGGLPPDAPDQAVCFAEEPFRGVFYESPLSAPEEMVLITQNLKEVKQIMSNYVGIVRSDLRLERATARLEIIYRETEELYKKSNVSLRICQLRNLINVGYLVIKMAQARKESRGLHYNLDYPRRGEQE